MPKYTGTVKKNKLEGGFFELIADALPGILLRLHQGIIGVSTIPRLASIRSRASRART